jgi:conjugal transfer pilus assembly protein TraF
MKKIAFSIVCICYSLAVFAQETSKQPTNFYKEKERGWFWFEDPAKEPEEKPAVKQQSPKAQSTPSEKVPLDANWLKENMDKIMLKAMSNPTDENMANLAYAQRLMLDMGSRLSSRMTDYMMGQPLLDENNRRPNSAFALNEFKAESNAMVKEVIEEVNAKTAGIWFFYSSTCSYCIKMLPVIKRFKDKYNVDVLAISLDGGALDGMEDMDIVVDYNKDVAKRFNVTLTPTTYLVMKNQDAKLVVEGMKSLPDFESKYLRTARINKLISEEQYAKTKSVYELNMFQNKAGQLYVDKDRLENDPSFLGEALKKQMGDIQPFGTRLVNQ